MSSIAYNDSYGLDKLTIEGGTTLEFRDKNKLIPSNVNYNGDSGFNMNRHLLMHNYDIAGGKNIGANNGINAINYINANHNFKRKSFRDNMKLNFNM